MRSTANALLVIAGLALAGCGSIGAAGKVKPQLPTPDKRLTDINWCGAAPARTGEDARITARRKELARRCERGRVEAWNGFYVFLQRSYAGK